MMGLRAFRILQTVALSLLVLPFSAVAQTQDVSFSPSSLSWGSVQVGQTSGAKSVTLTNNQSVPLTISGIALPLGSDFILSSTTCPMGTGTVAAGASCSLSVQFRPLAQGSRSSQVTVSDDAPSGTQKVTLAGTSVVGPILFSPTSVTFPNTASGSSSAPQSVTLTNEQSNPITLTGFTTSSGFAQTNNCPVSPNTLAAGGTCTLSVSFTPGRAGAFSGQVGAAFNTGTSTSSLSLYLNGATPVTYLTLGPTSQNFGTQTVGSSSSPQSFTLTNVSSSSITISSINTTLPDYTTSSTCPGTLAAGAACPISVTFTPTTTGSRNDVLTVASSAPGSGPSASLLGTGASSTPPGSVSFSPGSLAWGSVIVGQTAAAKSITITNNQSGPLTISSIATGSEFVQTANSCPLSPSTLAAGGTCSVSLGFRPLAQGARADTLTVTDNAPDSPQTAALSGTGTVGPLLFSPTSLSFSSTAVGSQSAVQTATLTNTQSSAVSITSITASGPFSQTNNCPSSLPANGNCTVSITFTPNAAGNLTGSINVASASGIALYLSGTGTSGGGTGSVSLTPASHSFGTQAPGTAGSPYVFTLNNGQSSALSISSIGISTADFTQTNTCGTSLAAQNSCTISVAFAPGTAGAKTATLSVNDDAGNSPQVASLSGTGSSSTGSGVSVSPKSYVFPQQVAGTSSSPLAVTLSNNQSSALAISSVQVGAPFSQTNTCGSSVPANGSCQISITYSPTAIGYSSANLTITDNATGSPQAVALSGNAVAPIAVNPKGQNLGFFNQVVKTPSTPLNVTLTNNDSQTVTINSITTTVDFPITSNCVGSNGTGTLAAQASCTIAVVFDPQATGARAATLSVATNTAGSPTNITMTGTGMIGDRGPNVGVSPNQACVLPSNQLQYSADVREISNTAVKWYVDGILGGNSSVGTISTTGLYSAPSAAGSHSIKALSQGDTSVSGTTGLTVTAAPGMSIYPYNVALPPGGQQTYQAQLCSAPDANAVSFSVDNIVGGNSTVGTITSAGVYTAPSATGKHTIRVTDSAVGKTSGSIVTVYGSLTVDFGSRTNTAHPIPANIFGAGRSEALHSAADASLLTAAGVTTPRLYAQIESVFATQTANWTKLDGYLTQLQTAGQHPMLQLAHTPPWLQPTTGGCANSLLATPTNINSWGQLMAQVVAHVDSKFPGLVGDYEIWNEPNAANLCSTNHLSDYMKLYAAAAPLMKQQAAADGVSIRIGGPVTAGLNSTWFQSLLSDSTTAPYVDFVSYHQYLFQANGLDAQWDSYDTINSVYQLTQDPTVGAAALYAKAESLVAAGSQPGKAATPVYITEYNVNSAFFETCCSNDPTYAPLWNALYISDVLNTVYTGSQQVPTHLIYFAASAYPYFCLIGVLDPTMDCMYSAGSTPVPYPQYYTYQLLGSTNYLGLMNGGYMAASLSPPSGGGGIVTTAFYTSTQDAIVIVNPTATSYSQVPVTANNVGFGSPQGTLYQIVNGNTINSSSLSLTPQGSGFTATISVPPYSVQAIALK